MWALIVSAGRMFMRRCLIQWRLALCSPLVDASSLIDCDVVALMISLASTGAGTSSSDIGGPFHWNKKEPVITAGSFVCDHCGSRADRWSVGYGRNL